VDAREFDLDGLCNPCHPDDRILPGGKVTISESELGVLRGRLVEAARSKARRGKLRIPVPLGCLWRRDRGGGLSRDLRFQEIIRLVFRRFEDLGSARQVLLSLHNDGVHFPRPSDGKRLSGKAGRLIRHSYIRYGPGCRPGDRHGGATLRESIRPTFVDVEAGHQPTRLAPWPAPSTGTLLLRRYPLRRPLDIRFIFVYVPHTCQRHRHTHPGADRACLGLPPSCRPARLWPLPLSRRPAVL
jgi:hypothetical protein